MIVYRHVTTFGGTQHRWLSRITDLDLVESGGKVRLVAATPYGGGVSSLSVGAPDAALDDLRSRAYPAGFGYQGEPQLGLVTIDGRVVLHVAQVAGATDAGVQLDPDTGGLHSFTPVFGGALGSHLTGIGQIDTDGAPIIYATPHGSPEIRTFSMEADGTLTPVGRLILPNPTGGTDASLDQVIAIDMGGRHILVSISGNGNFIATHKVEADGTIIQGVLHQVGGGTGYDVPSVIDSVQLNGQTFVVVGSNGSSSLTVFGLSPDGTLTTKDHILDEGGTRFQSATALKTVVVNDRAFIFAGGADDGISVFTLLPDGRLLHLTTIEDTDAMTLADVGEIEARVVDGQIQVFVSSSTETGITQLLFDPGEIGMTRLATPGTFRGGSAGDMITAAPTTTRIEGGAGDDILIAGQGSVTLVGGAGSDIFAPSQIRGRISIADFTPGIDQLDLSLLGNIRSVWQLRFQPTANGILVIYGETILDITTADGRPMSIADFSNAMFPVAHYQMPELDPTVPVDVPSTEPEWMFGTAEADHMMGAGGPEMMRAGAGDDTLSAGAGDDTLHAEDGQDMLRGGSGHDQLFAGAGRDTLMGDDGDDQLRGEGGPDLIYGGAGNDTAWGGAGNDLIYGGAGNDALTGDAGNDTLSGEAGNDRLTDLSGNNRLLGGDGHDILTGGSGSDFQDGGTGNDTLLGGAAPDRLLGGVGRDQLTGGAGNDWLDGGADQDLLAGGDGNDILMGGTGHDTLMGDAGNDALLGGEMNDLLRGGTGGDRLRGGNGGDRLFGDAGIDWLYGEAGNDAMAGGTEADILFGGAGNDLLLGDQGNDILLGQDGTDVLQGGDGNDRLNGGLGNDRLLGGVGDDVMVDLLGSNIFVGGDGHDRMVAGAGNDRMDGGAGNDRMIAGAGRDYLLDLIGHNRLEGGLHDDALITGSGFDVLLGDGGNDLLQSGAGNDRLFGGIGNDRLFGQSGNDWFDGGAGNDYLSGGDGHDVMQGGIGDDRMMGDGGGDTLVGGAGQDVMQGGAGHDTFRFLSAADSPRNRPDVILDFQPGIDRLDLSAMDPLYAGQGPHRGARSVRWDHAGGMTNVHVDLNGDGRPDMTIRLAGHLTLDGDDFLL